MKQNDEFSVIFLKYLNERDFDIKKINKINILSSMIDYMIRFKHDY